ncbi:MAG: BrnA antitoxin family protein [Burkholderiaceae bacterium]|jgi:uncharacterized protein (DUF4415 family)|nr:BrnA antitoxin family protein [Burkholderiaceae bacterium]
MSKRSCAAKKLPADFPRTPPDWEALIDAAPGDDTPEAQIEVDKKWSNAVLIPAGGGPLAVREALARRTRGLGKKPARAMTTLRLPVETLERWRASGPGWQTRAAEVLTAHAPG